MTRQPEPREIVDITGPEGETLFWHLKTWLVIGKEGAIQQYLDETWEHYKDIHDHRLLALVGALCLERSIVTFQPSVEVSEEKLGEKPPWALARSKK